MPFSARKMHFFEKNGNLTTCSAQLSADVKELFFWEVILHQFLKRKKWALLGKNVQTNLTLLNFAQKVPFLEDWKKKVSKCADMISAKNTNAEATKLVVESISATEFEYLNK